jgi:hypothetical protein
MGAILVQSFLREHPILIGEFGIEWRKMCDIHHGEWNDARTKAQKRDIFRDLLKLGLTEGLSKIKPSQVVYHGAAEHDREEHLWI